MYFYLRLQSFETSELISLTITLRRILLAKPASIYVIRLEDHSTILRCCDPYSYRQQFSMSTSLQLSSRIRVLISVNGAPYRYQCHTSCSPKRVNTNISFTTQWLLCLTSWSNGIPCCITLSMRSVFPSTKCGRCFQSSPL